MKPNKDQIQRSRTVLIGAAIVGAALLYTPTPSHANGSATCSTRDKVVAALSEAYAENPVSIGLSDEGAVIEVMASDAGSFTIVVTHPNGLTCPLAAGKAWQSIAAQLKGEGA